MITRGEYLRFMATENDKAKIYFAAITCDIKTHNRYVRLWNSKRIYAKGRPGLVVRLPSIESRLLRRLPVFQALRSSGATG